MKHIIQTTLSWIPVLAGLLLVIELILSNELAGLGATLQKTMQETQEATMVHETLVAQAAAVTSLAALQNRARELGFREPTKDQILSLGTSQLPVAFQLQ